MQEPHRDKHNENDLEECEKLMKQKVEIIEGPTVGKRHIQVMNLCLLIFVVFYERTCLSVAIVAMNNKNASSNAEIPTFNWNTKNIILSSLFFGNVPSQILLGCFLHRMRVKAVVLAAVLFQVILGMLVPTAAIHFGDKAVIVIRILTGIGQSFTYPVVSHLLSRWVPPKERTLLAGITFGVLPFGTLSAMFVSGYIAASGYGWPWIFYTSSIVTLLFGISFAIFSYDKPSSHPTITANEKNYIEKELAVQNFQKVSSTPYKTILTSLPVWTVTFANIGYTWSYYTLQSQLPMYLNYVIKFNIQTIGLLAALPYLLQGIVAYLLSIVSNVLIKKHYISTINCRKVTTSLALLGPAICLISLQSSGPNEAIKVVVLLNFAVGIMGAVYSGSMINMLDLTTKYAGFLKALINSIAQLTGFMTPLFAQAVIKHETDSSEWQIVFYAAAGLNIVAAIFFDIFASAEIQPWDTDDNSDTEDIDEDCAKNGKH